MIMKCRRELSPDLVMRLIRVIFGLLARSGRRRLAGILLIALATTISKVNAAHPDALSSDKTIQSIPSPPMQDSAWNPPKADVPERLIAATRKLFDQGMADPRGCEYRTVTVGADGSYLGNGRVVRCRGWLLPQSGAQSDRFAVCWDGLVHQVLAVGEKADVESDVRTLIEANVQYHKGGPVECLTELGLPCQQPGMALSRNVQLPEKVCLLLRLGMGSLAVDLWKQFLKAYPIDDKANLYLELAHDVLSNALCRAEGAHRRGDDRLAWLCSLSLSEFKKSVDREIAARHIPIKDNEFSYLAILPDLLADDERRAHLPAPARSPLELGRDAYPNKEQWIAALIENLDQVRGEQFRFAWYCDPENDPVVNALTACGDDAVQPLIDCYQSDDRGTRAINGQTLYMVSDAALSIIQKKPHTKPFAWPRSGEDRKELAQKLSEYWNNNRNLSVPDQCYRTLADDNEALDRWEGAFGDIIEFADELDATDPRVKYHKPGDRPLRGEALRARTHPSVFDIVSKRILKLDELQDIDPKSDPVSTANGLTMQLAEWDPVASIPVLRHQLGCAAGVPQEFMSFDSGFQRGLALLAITMARNGDPSGLKTYAEWFRNQNARAFELNFFNKTLLSPLWMFPADPNMAATAQWMFEDPKSFWNPLFAKAETGYPTSLLTSPLIGLPCCRAAVLKLLQDQSEIGTVTIKANREVEFTINGNRFPIPIRIDSSQIVLPPTDTKLIVRVCDRYASFLSAIPGMPQCEVYWPIGDRDTAVKKCSETLNQYGSRLQDGEEAGLDSQLTSISLTNFVFPSLGHPASKTEVSSGNAVFSLEDMGERRIVKSLHFPKKARWIALKKYPTDGTMWTPDRKEKPVVIYCQDYNQTGVPLSITSNLVVHLDGHQLALAPGVTLSVEKQVSVDDDDLKPSWIAIPSKTPFEKLATGPQTKPRTLEADEQVTLMDLNLRDYFNLTEPGLYQVTLRIEANCGLGDSPSENGSTFMLH